MSLLKPLKYKYKFKCLTFDVTWKLKKAKEMQIVNFFEKFFSKVSNLKLLWTICDKNASAEQKTFPKYFISQLSNLFKNNLTILSSKKEDFCPIFGKILWICNNWGIIGIHAHHVLVSTRDFCSNWHTY